MQTSLYSTVHDVCHGLAITLNKAKPTFDVHRYSAVLQCLELFHSHRRRKRKARHLSLQLRGRHAGGWRDKGTNEVACTEHCRQLCTAVVCANSTLLIDAFNKTSHICCIYMQSSHRYPTGKIVLRCCTLLCCCTL